MIRVQQFLPPLASSSGYLFLQFAPSKAVHHLAVLEKIHLLPQQLESHRDKAQDDSQLTTQSRAHYPLPRRVASQTQLCDPVEHHCEPKTEPSPGSCRRHLSCRLRHDPRSCRRAPQQRRGDTSNPWLRLAQHRDARGLVKPAYLDPYLRYEH